MKMFFWRLWIFLTEPFEQAPLPPTIVDNTRGSDVVTPRPIVTRIRDLPSQQIK